MFAITPGNGRTSRVCGTDRRRGIRATGLGGVGELIELPYEQVTVSVFHCKNYGHGSDAIVSYDGEILLS